MEGGAACEGKVRNRVELDACAIVWVAGRHGDFVGWILLLKFGECQYLSVFVCDDQVWRMV